MKASREVLEERRRMLHARIAAQRALFAQQVQHLERPARGFDRLCALGAKAYEHAGTFAVTAALAMLVLRRPLRRSVMTGWRLARRLTRALAFAKLAQAFMRRHPPSRQALIGRPASLKHVDAGSGAL